MEAYNTSTYPVFEADQVLSQKELNLLISHLEEQDRLTRKHLIGLGIICGLDVTFPSETSVKISCGTAVTSLGFQMEWKDQEFTHFHDYELSEQFLNPDYTKEPHLDYIFKHSSKYEPIKQCFELLPSNTSATNKEPIPNDFFNDKLILLLLEVTLIDQKNCDTTNCDDKGKRIEFNIRPLVITKNELTEGLTQFYNLPEQYSKLTFPRYNVPFQNLTTANDVLEGFKKVYNDSFLTTINDAISSVYQDFKSNLLLETNLTDLENSKAKIEATVARYEASVNVQYLWDWMFDIVEAYNEIITFKDINPSLCCVNENIFPFHVVLGGKTIGDEAYRTPFIKTLNGSNETFEQQKTVTVLFQKLAQILISFEVEMTNTIKVTPSFHGNYSLSKKTIPFYYDNILDINKKWNPELTSKGKQNSILSYHSNKAGYTNKPEVLEPLMYDNEPYNFYRIEGHIGMNYKKAVEDINLIRDSYALPFKVTALNAMSFLNKEIDISKFDGRWDDLETDYDLSRKRVYNITEFVINWMDLRRVALNDNNIISNQNIDNFKNILTQIKDLLTNDLKEFLPNHTSFHAIFKQLNHVFLFHRWCIQAQNATLSTIAEDLIDRLDDVNELFLEDPFTVIYEEANLRWQEVYKELFLSTFIKKHPGIDHKSGVTKGGQYILAYVDSSIFNTPEPPTQHLRLLEEVKGYKANINIDANIKAELIESIELKSYKSQAIIRPSTSSLDACQQETKAIKANLLSVVKYNMGKEYTLPMNRFILNKFEEVMQHEVSSAVEINPYENMVIADFFIPYTCCSEGSSIEVKIETKRPLTIALDTLSFCHTDTTEHEIIRQGSFGGTFTGTAKDAVVSRSDKYYLVPNHNAISSPGKYTLAYTVDNETSNTLEFEIETPAQLAWLEESDNSSPGLFWFLNPNTEDTNRYQFDFGDGTDVITTTENRVSHQFELDTDVTQFNVTITQLDAICQTSQTLNIVRRVNRDGDFSASDFNTLDFNTNQ